jgi:hypothetical protein
MRLVFVHGMRQENQVPDKLRAVWEEALKRAWGNSAISPYTLDMPFYGKVLGDLTDEVTRANDSVIARGEDSPRFTAIEEEMLRRMQRAAGISDAEIADELGQEIVTRGPANWEWLQAIARRLEKKYPSLGDWALSYVRQVDAYLTRPHIKKAVDDIVGPALLAGQASGEPTVVIAHSLGTIVSYRLLRQAPQKQHVRLYFTLGSPLGIETVKRHLLPPKLAKPECVGEWVNGFDERDYVALVSQLHDSYGAGVTDLPALENSEADPHAIVDYLGQSLVSNRIRLALASPRPGS